MESWNTKYAKRIARVERALSEEEAKLVQLQRYVDATSAAKNADIIAARAAWQKDIEAITASLGVNRATKSALEDERQGLSVEHMAALARMCEQCPGNRVMSAVARTPAAISDIVPKAEAAVASLTDPGAELVEAVWMAVIRAAEDALPSPSIV